MWKNKKGTEAGVHLMEAVPLIWGSLNTDFTVHEKGSATRTMVMHPLVGAIMKEV